jgi:hypothetical protein
MWSSVRGFLIRFFGLDKSMHAIHQDQRILRAQLDFLIEHSNRKVRRKWKRMLTRKTSPFYIGDINDGRYRKL